MSDGDGSLEDLLRVASRALVIGVGGGGDVVGALACARFLEFSGLDFVLGGLSWERAVYDPQPGPRRLAEVENVRQLHEFAWLANADSRTRSGVYFAESKMAAALRQDILLLDINGGVSGAAAAMESAIAALNVDFLVGLDVGGDSMAHGHEPGLRSPLADAVMLAAFAELSERGHRVLWGVFGYGSDGELTVGEIENSLGKVAAAGGLLGGWALTPKIARELKDILTTVPTEASAIPVDCFYGASGVGEIRGGQRRVKLTPLTTLTFFMSPAILLSAVSKPAAAVRSSKTLDEANDALHALGIRTELDFERDLSLPGRTI